ncbi:MAG TPA: hypothetical protein VHL80_09590 [Polyangia bacterium]|nr:hypothetical protein [Polyangia bacterium]
MAICACGSSSNAPAEGTIYASCTNVDAGTTCVGAAPGFASDIVPILQKSCLPACHDSPEGTPDAAWPLTDYDDVQSWSTFIAADIIGCAMPPLANASQYPITREDRETILQWILCDTPP